MTAPDPEDIVSRLDAMVEPAPEPENTVLTDQSQLVRWTGPAFALFSLILIPWTVYIGATLPARQLSPNYDLSWAGFDVIELIALASTAYFALRRSRYLAISAAAAGTLLVTDAWFDCMTTPAAQRWESFLLAALVELPLAAVCGWLSYHTQQLAERRVILLQRLGRRRPAPAGRVSRQARGAAARPAAPPPPGDVSRP